MNECERFNHDMSVIRQTMEHHKIHLTIVTIRWAWVLASECVLSATVTRFVYFTNCRCHQLINDSLLQYAWNVLQTSSHKNSDNMPPCTTSQPELQYCFYMLTACTCLHTIPATAMLLFTEYLECDNVS